MPPVRDERRARALRGAGGRRRVHRRRVERYDDAGATKLNLLYVLRTKPLGADSG